MSAPNAASEINSIGLPMSPEELAEDAERWLTILSAATTRKPTDTGKLEFREDLARQAKTTLQTQAQLDHMLACVTLTDSDIDYALSLYKTDAALIEALLDDLYDQPESALNQSDDALELSATEAACLRRVRALLVRTALMPRFVVAMANTSSLRFHEILLIHAVFERHRRAHSDCDIASASVCSVCQQFNRAFRAFMGRQRYAEDLHNAIMVLTVIDNICAYLRRRKERRFSEDSLLAFGTIVRPAMWNVYFTVLAQAPYDYAAGALRDLVALLDNTHNCDVIFIGVQDWWTAPMALYRLRAGDVAVYTHSILASIQAHAFVALPTYRDLLDNILDVAEVQLGDEFARQTLVSLVRKLGRRHFPQQNHAAKPWLNLLSLLDLIKDKVTSGGLRLEADGSLDAVDQDLVLTTLRLLRSIGCDEDPTSNSTGVGDDMEQRVLSQAAWTATLLEDVRLFTTIIPIKLRLQDNRLAICNIIRRFEARIQSPKQRLAMLTKAAALPFHEYATEVVDPFLSSQAPGRSLTLAQIRESVQTSDHRRLFRRYSGCWMASSLCAALGQFGMSKPKAIRVGLLLQATHSITPVANRNAAFHGGKDLFAFEAF